MSYNLSDADRGVIVHAISEAELSCQYALAEDLRAILTRASAVTVAEPKAGQHCVRCGGTFGGWCDCSDNRAACARQQAEPGAGVAEGWVAVPIEPTPKMLEQIKFMDNITDLAMTARYKAMLAAAPTPQQQAEPGEDERAAQIGMRDRKYVDSTPHLHVGNSAFEDWYQQYPKACVGDKQLARDAYAAGMGDPLVMARDAAKQRAEPVADERELPGVHGVGRIADNPCAVLVLLKAEPSDDALREIHDRLRATQSGQRATDEAQALRDMLDDSRTELEMIRKALGVPYEPHQSLMERTIEAAEKAGQRAGAVNTRAAAMLRWVTHVLDDIIRTDSDYREGSRLNLGSERDRFKRALHKLHEAQALLAAAAPTQQRSGMAETTAADERAAFEAWQREELPSHHGSDYSAADVEFNCYEAALSAWLDRAKIAAQSGQWAGVAEGWKLVPLEPTPQMLEQIKFLDDITARAMTVRYKAMLAAAPTPAQQEGEQP